MPRHRFAKALSILASISGHYVSRFVLSSAASLSSSLPCTHLLASVGIWMCRVLSMCASGSFQNHLQGHLHHLSALQSSYLYW